jgi:hypothetical protein
MKEGRKETTIQRLPLREREGRKEGKEGRKEGKDGRKGGRGGRYHGEHNGMERSNTKYNWTDENEI